MDYEKLSETLRSLRLSVGFRQEDIANALYISRSAYSHVEEGKIRPSVEMLVSLSEIFNIPLEVFFYPKNNPTIETAGKRISRGWKEEIDTVGHLRPQERALIALLRSSNAPELYSRIFSIARESVREQKGKE